MNPTIFIAQVCVCEREHFYDSHAFAIMSSLAQISTRTERYYGKFELELELELEIILELHIIITRNV